MVSRVGNERILAFLGPGAVVGELSIIDGRPRSASAVAVRDSALSFLGRAAFEEFAQKHPEVYKSLVRLLATRLRETDNVVAAGSFLPLRGRVAITTGIIETAWRHGKSESTPSLTNVFRRRTSRLNFFARITSAPMSFRFCADGVAVLGTVWIPAAQSKRRSSAGACVDGNWRQPSAPSRGRRARSRYKVDDGWLALSNRISSSAKRSRPKRGGSRWKSFAPRSLIRRWLREQRALPGKTTREIEKAEKNDVSPQA